MSYTDIYEFAGIKVEVTSVFEDVHLLCKKYVTCGEAKYKIVTCAADIDYEREKSDNEALLEGNKPIKFTDGYLETLAVYRKIANFFINDGIILFHGSVLAMDGAGYLFTAKSGTGKSTHTRLWRKVYGDKVTMINDDKPLLRVSGEGVTVFGTPWDGKHKLSTNTSVPLKAICILSRSPENNIRRITPSEAYAMILQQTYRPTDAALMIKMLSVVDVLMKKVKFYALGCNMNDDAAILSYEGMKE